MNLRSTIFLGCLSALACSSGGMKKDAGTGDGGTFEVEPRDSVSDTGNDDAVNNDTGSGDADADVSREHLCDGVAHLRLWLLIAPAVEVRGSMVRVENGMPFVAIDGSCSYWISGGWTEDALSSDRPIRTGKMTDADIASIEESVPLGNVAPLRDCPPPPSNLFDYSIRVIRTAGGDAQCFTGAPSLTAGTRFEAAWMTFQMMGDRMWNDGTPMTGALHVSAADASDAASAQSPYTWPINSPLASFILPGPDSMKIGVSYLVDDPTAASQLRALRDRYLADRTAQPGLYANWDGLKATDQTNVGFVYMRDAMPYENAQGLLRF
jgi:hypothetical protein